MMINLPRDECSSTTFFLLRVEKEELHQILFSSEKGQQQEAGDDIVSAGSTKPSDSYSAKPAITNVYL